jgi:hypothetical protein
LKKTFLIFFKSGFGQDIPGRKNHFDGPELGKLARIGQERNPENAKDNPVPNPFFKDNYFKNARPFYHFKQV